LLQWLAGPVQTLYGRTANRLRHIEFEDMAVSLLQFENGAIGTMEITTTVHPDFGKRLEIHGEKGKLVYTEDQITLLDVLGEQIELRTFEPFVVVPDGHRVQIRDMVYAIREGRQPIVPGHEGRHSLEIILGTYKSSKQKQEIRLSDLSY
jgi:UDP-N-acetyl-2-amino-2-deoxyglucuronate dehydrogenase